ncbi:MAG: hypothetical protein ACFB00_05020 [Parvularculaceae bacterium]
MTNLHIRGGLAVAALAATACAQTTPAEVGASFACGVRESACVNQCRRSDPYDDDLVGCEAACAPSERTVCP